MTTVKRIFGITLRQFTDKYMPGEPAKVCRSNLETLACLGDAMLGSSVIRFLWDKAGADCSSTSQYQVSVEKMLCVSNRTLATYLRQHLSAEEIKRCEETFYMRLMNDSKSCLHRCGTLFEGLLWGVYEIDGREKADAVVTALCTWALQAANPEVVAELLSVASSHAESLDADDDDSGSQTVAQRVSDVISLTSSERLFPRAQRSDNNQTHNNHAGKSTPAPLQWKNIRSSPTRSTVSESTSFDLLAVHDFGRGDVQPHNCNIANRASVYNWHGKFCRLCHAMLVTRRVSNRKSEYFVVGMNDCPGGGSLVSWLADYQRQFPNMTATLDDSINTSCLRDWLLMDEDLKGIDCAQCGSVYTYTQCTNANKCKQGNCSNKHPCKKETRLPCTCEQN